ncbi:Serum paraoxonase/arylesterase 2 [Holothuria leucospilota]|uniref:Paraoxonase n=1 Tax=Holothuria leucospilota TaxID=206669 RepID=A0A9Q1H2K8_HOLLE|nr:Serum paraoxonase/arylesterase 2 [Holothuria leucospilota]
MLWKAIAILLALLVTRHFVNLALLLGYHKTSLMNHWPGPCRTVPPVENGAEDIALTKSGLAIITSGIDINYRADATDPRISEAEGKLFAFDFNHPEKNAVELKFTGDFEFVPHGIGIWESADDGTFLFVVNHRRDAETIEIFKLSGTAAKPILEHVESVQDPLFTSMNDVVATGPRSFYVSNDGYLRYTVMRAVERLFNRPWGSVVHYNGKTARKVVDSAFEYNGMSLSRDGKFLFISCPFALSIAIYERSTDSNDLSFQQDIHVGTFPDNIFVHPGTGDLWIGCSPIGHRVFAAFGNLDNWAPSQAIRVRPLGTDAKPFEKFKLYEVYYDDAHLMSSSSSAVVVGNKLLVGSIVHKLVFCDMKTETNLPRDQY